MSVGFERPWVICVVATLTLALVVVIGGQSAEAQSARSGDTDAPSFPTSKEAEFASGRILVKQAAGSSEEDIRALNRRNGARIQEEIPRSRVDVVRLPENLPVEQAVRRYESSPDVEYAEPDFLLSPSQSTATPSANDPDYPKLYGLNNTGQSGGTDNADIDAPEAWASTTGSPDTTVAVIDTGVDVSHPDLRNNVWVNADEIPANGVDDDGNGYVDDVNGWDFANEDNTVFDAADGDKHGTHVAGTIAAEGNNSLGVAGVTWSTKVMPLKFLGPKGGYTSDAVEAINYAVANRVPISNNSWGGGGYSQTLKDTVDRAGSSGHLFVAAAGNGGSDGVGDDSDATPAYPASYDSQNIVSVAATDAKDSLAIFSNFGAKSVDLGAPGVGILSTLPGDNYGSYNGTSMATPHVSGVAALIKSINPEMNATKLKEQLLGTAEPIQSLSAKTVTGGRLNAAESLGETATELELSSSRASLVFGGGTVFSGSLVSAAGEPLVNEEVILQQRPAGERYFSRLGKVSTASDGTFRLPGVKPSKNTVYRARYAGDATESLGASVSPTSRVDVKVRLTLSLSSTDLVLGKSRAVSGSVAPTHTGSVRLVIKRNGSVIERKTANLTDSRYRIVYKPPRLGNYAIYAVFSKDTDHLGNRSPQRSFKVVR